MVIYFNAITNGRRIDKEETWTHWVQCSYISYLDGDSIADGDPCLLVKEVS